MFVRWHARHARYASSTGELLLNTVKSSWPAVYQLADGPSTKNRTLLVRVPNQMYQPASNTMYDTHDTGVPGCKQQQQQRATERHAVNHMRIAYMVFAHRCLSPVSTTYF